MLRLQHGQLVVGLQVDAAEALAVALEARELAVHVGEVRGLGAGL